MYIDNKHFQNNSRGTLLYINNNNQTNNFVHEKTYIHTFEKVKHIFL